MMPIRDLTLRVRLATPHAIAPVYKTAGAGAMDLFAAEAVTLAPGERRVVNTGVAVEIPPGYAGWVKSRSGLCRQGFTVDGGLVDSDYRGEIGVQCWNAYQDEPGSYNYDREWRISIGDRIAQLVLLPVGLAAIVVVDSLDDTERGASGFGSTGK